MSLLWARWVLRSRIGHMVVLLTETPELQLIPVGSCTVQDAELDTFRKHCRFLLT